MNYTLSRWDPFHELDTLNSRLSTLFDHTAGKATEDNSLAMQSWTPSIDITEDENEFLIKAELPGVDKKDITLNIEQGVLSIQGERKAEQSTHKNQTHRMERVYGTFYRSFQIPSSANPSKINANYKNGVLSIHLPKTPVAQPKKLEIKVA